MRQLVLIFFICTTKDSLTQITVNPASIEFIDSVTVPTYSLSLDATINYPHRYERLRSGRSTLYDNDLDCGIRFSYMKNSNKRVNLGFEYGLSFGTIDLYFEPDENITSFISSDVLNIQHEGLEIITHNVIPKLEWKIKHDKNRYGFWHQFGVGVSFSRILNKKYKYYLVYNNSENNDAEYSYKTDNLYNHSSTPFWGASIMYICSFKFKISSSISSSIGIRSQLNLNSSIWKEPYKGADWEDREYWISKREMNIMIAENRLHSFMHLQVGLSYEFKNED